MKTKPTQQPFTLHCLELLAALGSPRARAMFGGVGLYVDELFIALIADERLYLKAGEAQRPAFEAAGCTPFRYTTRDGREMSMGYWSAPESALESPQAMRPWATLARQAALAKTKA